MNWSSALTSPVTMGIFLGLLIGKPVGIVGFTYLASRLGRAPLTRGVTWPMITGVGLLAGIGFTMSLFITGLSLDTPAGVANAKLAIILVSLAAGLLGYGVIRKALPEKVSNGQDPSRQP
jgi:NhaA family Na+:H+ antiporter